MARGITEVHRSVKHISSNTLIDSAVFWNMNLNFECLYQDHILLDLLEQHHWVRSINSQGGVQLQHNHHQQLGSDFHSPVEE